MRYQFGAFKEVLRSAVVDEADVKVMEKMMQMMQHMCEDHNFELQNFVGEDLDDDDDDDDEADIAAADKDDDGDDEIVGPDNLVQLICETLATALSTVEEA